jgi:hypothetical protein
MHYSRDDVTKENKRQKEMAKFIAFCLMDNMNLLLILLPIMVFNFLQKNNLNNTVTTNQHILSNEIKNHFHN